MNLVAELGTLQANVSGHLACLRDCGLVAAGPRPYELLPAGPAGAGRAAQVVHVRPTLATF